jgi:hypothetical protein
MAHAPLHVGTAPRASSTTYQFQVPNPKARLRLAGAVLAEPHDAWQVSDRRYLVEGSMASLGQPSREVAPASSCRHLLPGRIDAAVAAAMAYDRAAILAGDRGSNPYV